MYTSYNSDRFRNVVISKKIISNVEKSSDVYVKWNKSMRDLLNLYMKTYVELTDDEIDIFAQQGLLHNLGFKDNDVGDKRPYEHTFFGRLDYKTRIRPLLLAETKNTESYFINFTKHFYRVLHVLTAEFFENIDPHSMRKYDRNDHERKKEEMRQYLKVHLEGEIDTEMVNLKQKWIDMNIAVLLIGKYYKSWKKKWMDSWCIV